MKKSFILAISFLCIFASVCIAKTPNFMPQPISENQKIIYNQGVPVLISELDNSSIAISILYRNKELYFDIAISNTSDTEMDVIPENIQVIGYNKKDMEKLIEVYVPQKYYEKVANKMAWNIILQGLVAVSDSFTSGTSTTTTRSSNGNVLATSTTYDSAKAAQVAAQDQAAIQKAGSDGKTTLDNLKKFLLWRNTLIPGSSIEGCVVTKYNSSFNKKYVITIPVGTDTYEVQFINE